MYCLIVFHPVLKSWGTSKIIYKNFYSNGIKHRIRDLPAVKKLNGDEQWWIKGNLHRENDLPAAVYINGDKEWYYEGYLHRENNLPAVVLNSGKMYWYCHGQQYFLQENGTKEFVNIHGKLHRKDDLPAVEYSNGDREWWIKGKRHRIGGPAVIIGDKEFWFEFGVFIKCSL